MLTDVLLYFLLVNNLGLTTFVLKNIGYSSYSYPKCQNLNIFVIALITILPFMSCALISYNLSTKYNSRRDFLWTLCTVFIVYIVINCKILYILDSNNCIYYITNTSYNHWVSCIWMILTAILTPIIIAKMTSNYII